jgi:alkylhydroperoxidase family enzyme
VDIHSAVGRKQEGLSEEELAEISEWRTGSRFSAAERAALRFAEEMCKTSVNVPDSVFDEVRSHFDDRQIVELSATIGLENMRARMNRSLLIESDSLVRSAGKSSGAESSDSRSLAPHSRRD